jgi:hypothetical protein
VVVVVVTGGGELPLFLEQPNPNLFKIYLIFEKKIESSPQRTLLGIFDPEALVE